MGWVLAAAFASGIAAGASPAVAQTPAASARSGGADARAVQAYAPQHRSAESLQPLAEAALAGAGSATVDPATNALLLVGEQDTVAAALALLRTFDRPARSVTVRARWQGLAALDAAGARIDWSGGAGPLRVGTLASEAAPAAGAHDRVLRSGAASPFEAVVRVLEGETGRIVTGEGVPVDTHALGGTPAFVEVGSGLLVRPWILGDGRVQLEVSPFTGALDARGRLGFTEAATRVVLAPGEVAVVAGSARRALSSARRRAASGLAQTREEQVLVLEVESE